MDPLTDIQTEKAHLRREILQMRNALSPAERMRLGEVIAGHLLDQAEVRNSGTIFLYLTYRSEVPTEPLIIALAEQDKRICVPHMTTGIRALMAAEYEPGDLLEPGPYGVSQPVEVRQVPPGEVNLILAPGAAFDRAGARMGYGKGYYDRFLCDPALNARIIGVAYDLQIVPKLPTEPHDRPMDALVTESAFHILSA
jgi:5-formyltetrahydrofolate cyclo-ligase